MSNLFRDSPLHCYYCTGVSDTSVNSLFNHYTREHKQEKFSLRQLTLNDQNGELFLKSVHFPVRVDAMQNRINQGDKCIIDVTNACIRFKRVATTDVTEGSGEIHVMEQTDKSQGNEDSVDDTDDGEPLANVMKKAYDVIKETGRGNDFVSLITAISNGTLEPHHIALHLLLDIGNFLSHETVYNMRYTDATMDFWSKDRKT